MVTKAPSAYAGDKPLKPSDIERRQLGPYDVQIDIAYCGVCHSDLHQVRSEWGDTIYPCVLDHDIVGHVSAVGNEAMKFKVGDTVNVSRIVDPCQRCVSRNDGLEQYCEHGFTGTYNCPTRDAPGHTLSAYSQQIVVKERFKGLADKFQANAEIILSSKKTEAAVETIMNLENLADASALMKTLAD